MIGIGLSLWQAALGGGGGSSIPAWVLLSGATPATMDIDFFNDRAWNAGALTSVAAMLACSRASSGYYTKADGTLQNFSSNTLRYGTNGLLVEDAATNEALNSEDFTNATWNFDAGATGLTRTANQATAPNGANTADKIALNAAIFASAAYIAKQQSGLTTPHTASCYMKAAEYSFGVLSVGSFGGGFYAVFNLTNGTVATAPAASNTSATIEALANGWYRCSITTSNAGSLKLLLISVSPSNSIIAVGDGSSGIYVWGAQLELGSVPSSYIPTTSSAATRAADAVTFSDLTWSDGANDTIYAEWLAKNVNNANVWAFDATNDKALDEQTGMSARIAGATVANTVAAGAVAKAAARMKVNDFGISMNGGTAATDVSEAAPGTLTASRLGADLAGANFLNSYIRRVATFKGLAANDAALVSLSA